MWIHVLWLAVSDFFPFFGLIAEQLPGQQSRETAGPQVHSGPAHQYNLLQNEGIVSFSSTICAVVFLSVNTAIRLPSYLLYWNIRFINLKNQQIPKRFDSEEKQHKIFILKLGAELDLRLFWRTRNGEKSANQLGFLHIVYLSCRISHFSPWRVSAAALHHCLIFQLSHLPHEGSREIFIFTTPVFYVAYLGEHCCQTLTIFCSCNKFIISNVSSH